MSSSAVSSGPPAPRLRRQAHRLQLGLLAILLCGVGASCNARPRLQENLTLEEGIRSGETHAYPAKLRAGQFLRVSVQEEGVDLQVQLVDAEEKVVTGVDGLLGGETDEDLAAIAESTGRHTLKVVAPEGSAGRYRLKVNALGEPRGQDGVLARAVRATWVGFHDDDIGERIRSLEQAFPLWQELGSSGKSGEVLFFLGYLRFESLAAYTQALPSFQQSAEIWARHPGRRGRVLQVRSLTYLGRCLGNIERRDEARKAHEQALALARELRETSLQAQNLNRLGRMDVEDGEARRGVGLLFEALRKTREAKGSKTEHNIFNNLAFGHERLGEMQKALEFYQQALDLALQVSDPEAEAMYRNNLGETYLALGNRDKAFDYFLQAAKKGDAVGDQVLTAKILINLAAAYRHRKQLDKARSSLDRALGLGRRVKSREVQVLALGNLAFLMLQMKQPAQALKHAREAAALAKSLEEQTSSRYALGSTFRNLGDTAAARVELEQALALAKKREDRLQAADIGLVLARVDRDGGDLASALSRVGSAIELIEKRRGGVIDPKLRTSFLASKQDYYEFQVDTLMALHAQQPTGRFAADALAVNERARARGLLDLLNEADVPLSADLALRAKERKARQEVNARDWYRRELLAQESPHPGKLREAGQKLAEALRQYEQVQVKLRQSNPRYAALTQPPLLGVAEIRRQVLDGGAMLLEYSLGARRSFLWAVTSDSFESFELPERARIEKLARRYYELLTVRGTHNPQEEGTDWMKRRKAADTEAEKVARELSRLILRPVEPLLGERPLLIVADGALHYIPFAALPLPSTGEFLNAGHEIVSLPSASVLAVQRRELRDRRRAPRALAIFANPVFRQDDERIARSLARLGPPRSLQASVAQQHRGDRSREAGLVYANLPFSQDEADAIAALLPAKQVFKATGFDASRENVAGAALEDYRNVHFATHGVLESSNPELSRLVLSLFNERGERQDGFLRLHDIYNLRLDADLAALSACKTALGKEIRGEGLVGLTRGFMYAGAARVLATLWSVDDKSTAELMKSFYRGMIHDGLSPAAALRKAQLETADRWKHPFYWAGFSLQGEWR